MPAASKASCTVNPGWSMTRAVVAAARPTALRKDSPSASPSLIGLIPTSGPTTASSSGCARCATAAPRTTSDRPVRPATSTPSAVRNVANGVEPQSAASSRSTAAVPASSGRASRSPPGLPEPGCAAGRRSCGGTASANSRAQKARSSSSRSGRAVSARSCSAMSPTWTGGGARPAPLPGPSSASPARLPTSSDISTPIDQPSNATWSVTTTSSASSSSSRSSAARRSGVSAARSNTWPAASRVSSAACFACSAPDTPLRSCSSNGTGAGGRTEATGSSSPARPGASPAAPVSTTLRSTSCRSTTASNAARSRAGPGSPRRRSRKAMVVARPPGPICRSSHMPCCAAVSG